MPISPQSLGMSGHKSYAHRSGTTTYQEQSQGAGFTYVHMTLRTRTLKTIDHRALALRLRRPHIPFHLMPLARPLLLKRSSSRNYLVRQSQRRSPLIPPSSVSHQGPR